MLRVSEELVGDLSVDSCYDCVLLCYDERGNAICKQLKTTHNRPPRGREQ